MVWCCYEGREATENMKDYFLKILEKCAPEDGETQDAIEYALLEHRVNFVGDFDQDVAQIMGKIEEIKAAYRSFKAKDQMDVIINLNLGVPITEISSGM